MMIIKLNVHILLKWCTRLADASDEIYQFLAYGRWFSPASSTTKTGRHDIAEILLKVALNTINQMKSISSSLKKCPHCNLAHFGPHIPSSVDCTRLNLHQNTTQKTKSKKDRQYNDQKKKEKQ